MPHQITLIEMLANIGGMIFGFWVFFPVVAIMNVLQGPGKVSTQAGRIPFTMFVLWCFFALWRVTLFVHPVPVFLAIVPEPLGSYLFVLAGLASFVLWRVAGRRNHQPINAPAMVAPTSASARAVLNTTAPAAPVCPKCGVSMVIRTARQGQHAGEQFYGCPNFPNCREKAPL